MEYDKKLFIVTPKKGSTLTAAALRGAVPKRFSVSLEATGPVTLTGGKLRFAGHVIDGETKKLEAAVRNGEFQFTVKGAVGKTLKLASFKPIEKDGRRTLRFAVKGMSCEKCEKPLGDALKKVPGVVQATVSFKAGSVTLQVEPGRVTAALLRKAAATLSMDAHFPGDEVLPPLTKEQRALLDIKTVSHGDAIKVKDHLTKGKITIFDYTAKWCGPCQVLTPKLERLQLKYEDLALRIVDIKDGKSAAAKQATRDLKIPGLPFVRILDDKGKELGRVSGNRIEQIEAILTRNGARLKKKKE